MFALPGKDAREFRAERCDARVLYVRAGRVMTLLRDETGKYINLRVCIMHVTHYILQYRVYHVRISLRTMAK